MWYFTQTYNDYQSLLTFANYPDQLKQQTHEAIWIVFAHLIQKLLEMISFQWSDADSSVPGSRLLLDSLGRGKKGKKTATDTPPLVGNVLNIFHFYYPL